MSIIDELNNSQTLVNLETQKAIDDVQTESIVVLLALDQDVDFEPVRLNISFKAAELI